MSDKINKKPSKISGYYYNNSRKNFDHTMNRIYDLMERDSYYKEQTEFVAKIVSGIATADNTAPQSDSFLGILNGRLQRSYKIRFIEQDEKFNKNEDPTTPGRTQGQINQLVSSHPDALYESSEDMPKAPSFNSVVLVTKQGLTYKITKILGNSAGTPGEFSRNASGAFNVNSPSFLANLSLLTNDPEKLKEREIDVPENIIDLIYTSFNQSPPTYNREGVYFFGVRTLNKTNYNLFADKMIVAKWGGTEFKLSLIHI